MSDAADSDRARGLARVLAALADPPSPEHFGAAHRQLVCRHLGADAAALFVGDEQPECLGAAGFIPKATESRLLREALATVLRGGVYVPAVALAANPAPHGQPASTDHLGLTQRQIEVLRMLVDGRSNKLIARELDLAPSTVKTHLEAIFQRLRVNSRTQAVVAAARLGLRL